MTRLTGLLTWLTGLAWLTSVLARLPQLTGFLTGALAGLARLISVQARLAG